jgi:diaminohydroxyphosphoribosylaminopyrimidine deaminase / 5-amino-6-(5-phosphoribosylamino)uracil reductase
MAQLDERDIELMELAFSESERCTPVVSAFNVGAVLTSPARVILSTGFSRETGAHEHAEEVAFAKARVRGLDVRGAFLYISLEPCGIRKSKSKSCSELALDRRVGRVIYAMQEPPFFVAEQSGLKRLRTAGVDVIHLPGFEQRFRQLHPHLFG